ncbi:MAG TPA: AIR synthase [Firmicutes bacterium]|nr:AIR synthase [Bacillota bacterium]
MLPAIGKVDKETFDKLIFARLGKKRPEVVIGPQHGVDAAAVKVIEDDDGERVMVIAEDPTFGMPALMPYFGWSIVHICAGDVATLGVAPQYMTICLLLPPGTSPDALKTIWEQIDQECEKLGISIIGGHTGIYPGISYPLNGGCTVIGFGTRNQLTPASNARPGDRLIMTKGLAIEATGVLAHQAEMELRGALGDAVVEKAKARLWDMTVVKDALIAAPLVHAMHDATEGGFLNAAYEMAQASGTGVRVYEDKIILTDEVEAVCNYFAIDPLISISEGTLVMAAGEAETPKLIEELGRNGIDAAVVGEFTDGDRVFVRRNGKEEALVPVKVDPFWDAYFRSLEQ